MKQCKRLFFIAMTLGIVVSLHAQIDTVWTRRYDGIDRDYVYAMTVDGQGNVYVTGSSKSSSSSYTENYLTIKYNANGVQQWAVPYNGPGVSISTDEAYSVAVDQSGNVYVTGKSYGAGTDYNYATIKYNANGVEQWVRRYNGPGNSADVAKVVAVDKAGNICVIGYSIGSGSSSDYTIIKYDSSGVELWVQRYNGPGNIYDVANAMVLDEQDNIYVTGGSSRGGTNYDYATIKYNSLGQERWVARYNGPANGSDNANAVTVDRQGNVYVTGASASSSVSPFNNDILTIKYDSMGAEQWVRRYDGPGNDYDYASAIAIDGQGNVVVTGASRASSSSFSDDYVTIKYDANGVEQWVQRYNGPGNSSDWSNALVIDSYNNIYVTGYSSSVASPTSNFDYATIKYSPNGIEQWVQRYDGPASLTDQATRIALAGQDIIYVSGNSTGVGTLNDYFTIKYRQDIHDISITEIVQPTGVIDSTSKIAPKVKVKNNGNMVESFFDVFFDVSSGYSNSKSVTNLGIGEERIVEFDSMLVGPRGTYTTRCSTYLANDVNPADNVLRDSFTVIAYNLNVSVIGNGSVDKNPDQPSYAPNSLVQLTANPDTGWHFTGWTGDTTGINNPVTVTTNSDKNITANFEINAYDLTVNIIGDGEVGREPNQTNYNHGTWVKLTAAPNPGWHFMGWSDSLTGSNNPDSILMNSDKVVTATFAIDTFTIVSSVAGNGTIDPLGTVYVTYGSNQAYNISPDIGYHIDSVVVDGVNQGVQTVWAFNSINANHTIVAYFSINTYAITASAIGNGTIIPSGVIVVNYGSDTLFTFAPAIGYHLDSLMVDGINHGADSTSYEFTSIDDDHTIDAYFSINAYTITASASTGGTIIPIGAISVNYGEDTTFSIVPDIGHHLDSLLVDGINHGADSTSYEFTSIDDDHTIAVYFLINTYTITASASTGGTIIPIGAISVNYGEDTTFSIIPDIGHHLDSLLVDGINHGADSTAFTFENITDDHTITAYFSINTYNLTININPSASGTVETDPPVGPYNHGIYVKLTAHPVDGYYFTDWTGGLTSTNIYDSILMNSEQTVNANFTLIPGWLQQDSLPRASDLKDNKYVKDGGALVGVGNDVYALPGNKSWKFYKYSGGVWDTTLANIPMGYKYPLTEPPRMNSKKVGKGAGLCADIMNNIIYATKGNGTKEFWAYDIELDSWIVKEPLPTDKAPKVGTSIAYLDGAVYLLAGGLKTADFFCKYDINANNWITLDKPITSLKPWKAGSAITAFNGKIYAMKGGDKPNYFVSYDPVLGWAEGHETLTTFDMVWKNGWKQKKAYVKDGGRLVAAEDAMYAIKGGGNNNFYKYTADLGWIQLQLDTIPMLSKRSVPKAGAALAYTTDRIWLMKGNNSPEFWSYGIYEQPVTHISPGAFVSTMTENTAAAFDLTVNVTPNPIIRNARINYSLPVTARATLKLYNTSGRLVETLLDNTMTAGTYSMNLNANKLAKGVYFLKYEVNNSKSEVKLIVQ